jgi:GDPmannose 4,6-dehydratase
MHGKTALITGISGQDGSYLAELLLAKGYRVHGLTRHASSLDPARIVAACRPADAAALQLHLGDLGDFASLLRLLAAVRPDEIYHLAAQSHVGVSFAVPEYTLDCNALGTTRLLEALRSLDLVGRTRFYQASTSELFGDAVASPQDEHTPFRPRSPYAVGKLAAHWQAVNYRQAYGLFACCGILFNHESPRRGEGFVSRKITLGLARALRGLQDRVLLGNLEARRDWGHARDYVRAQWLMLQQAQADDYVIASGEQHSVREFLTAAAAACGLQLAWEGHGDGEIARAHRLPSWSTRRPGEILVAIDPAQYRPNEVPALCGNPAKAMRQLGWRPETGFTALVEEMVRSDLALAGAPAP